MKQLLILLTLASLLLAACGGTPTPDVEATVQATVAATQTAQPTESPTPKPTETSPPAPEPTDTPVPTATPVPPTATPVPATPTPVPVQPTATSVPVPPYSGTYMVVNVASDDVLNVRANAGVAHPIVGVIPHNGTGVPAGNWINISVKVDVPFAQYLNFTGNITIINTDNPSEYCEINVFLETPKDRIPILPILTRVFARIIQRFPILQWLFYQQLIN